MGKSAAMLLPALVMIVAQQQERAGELMIILVAFGVGMGLISTKTSPFSCCTDKAMPIMAAKIERAAMSTALLVV